MKETQTPPIHVQETDVELTGCFVVFSPQCGHPMTVQLPGVEQECVPVFTTIPRMRRALRELGVGQHEFRRITNEDRFIASIPAQFEIVVDMYKEGDGTKFTLLDRKGSLN